MKLRQRSPEKDEHVWTLPGPSKGVDFVWVADEYRLDRLSWVEGSWLELNQAVSVGASTFREHQDTTDFVPLVERLHAVENVLNRGDTRVVILAANINRLCKIDELYK